MAGEPPDFPRSVRNGDDPPPKYRKMGQALINLVGVDESKVESLLFRQAGERPGSRRESKIDLLGYARPLPKAPRDGRVLFADVAS